MNFRSDIRSFLWILSSGLSLLSCGGSLPHIPNTLRAPSVPLVNVDPYFSAWSAADRLNDIDVQHWTGKDYPLRGALVVDGVSYRFMGAAWPEAPQAAKQTGVDVQATQTHYTFECGPVTLSLSFMTPLLPDDLDLLSTPVTHLEYGILSRDGKKHEMAMKLSASPLWALDTPDQEFTSSTEVFRDLVLARTGSRSQDILGKKGDDRRIDWGWFYMAARKDDFTSSAGADGWLHLESSPRKARKDSGTVLLGYDDIYSVRYFGTPLRPYWNRKGDRDLRDVLAWSMEAHSAIRKRCEQFDSRMMARAQKDGGRQYAELAALSYRQAVSAHKLVEGPGGKLFLLSKENFSNGSIGTVDVTYPSAPLFLYYNTELAKGLLNFIFDYAESGRWTKPFPAHDLGTYPWAEGQTYPEDMPVEEAGNMLILSAAICHEEGDAGYAREHWKTLSEWTRYLRQFGMDPEDQLCTDDFAGHLAHNANLSAKAIMGIASYGMMAGMLGQEDVRDEMFSLARQMAGKWKEMAKAGDHYALTFNDKDTWSMKYNLVWDKVLGLDIFDRDIFQMETAYYRKVQNPYGLPLDSRKSYAKIDWIVWTACLGESMEDFQSLIAPLYRLESETPDRVPLGDWTWTQEPRWINMKARSVVGGFFMRMLQKRHEPADRGTQGGHAGSGS